MSLDGLWMLFMWESDMKLADKLSKASVQYAMDEISLESLLGTMMDAITELEKKVDKPNMINWTPEMLKRFTVYYNTALNSDKTEFVFDGHTFLTSYAKYLIQYLQMRSKGEL